MSSIDTAALAQELMAAHASRQIVSTPPSSRDGAFDLAAGYAVEAELVRLRLADGHATVGRKVGFANKALWRVLQLDTLVWAHMYDDTVRYATNNAATLSLARMLSPKIEPEIVFKMKRPLDALRLAGDDPAAQGFAGVIEAADVLAAVEWLALGFEVIDCAYADWKYQPSDFVASFGLHAALIVGEPRRVAPELIPTLVEQLPRFKVSLLRNDELVVEGSGRNVLRSPALCLGELASAIARHPTAEPLGIGELVSSGTLTESQPIATGEIWTTRLDGLDLPPLTVST